MEERVKKLEEQVNRLETIHLYGFIGLLIAVPIIIYYKANQL